MKANKKNDMMKEWFRGEEWARICVEEGKRLILDRYRIVSDAATIFNAVRCHGVAGKHGSYQDFEALYTTELIYMMEGSLMPDCEIVPGNSYSVAAVGFDGVAIVIGLDVPEDYKKSRYVTAIGVVDKP
jgi:hypothetical protein